MVMLRLQDLRRSSCTRLSSSERVMCHLAIYYDFSENKTLAIQLGNAQKIYNVTAKIKRNRMQGRNTVEEVLYLSAERGYTVFHRNYEESNVQHATIRSCRDDSNRKERHSGNNFYGSIINEGEPLVILTDRESGLMSVWTSQVLHFGVETTNPAENEYFVLKVWLSTCYGDLDTVFFNIDSLIQGQIAEIKYTFEISKLKEKYVAKSNAILKNLSNKVIKKACEMVEEPESNCLHYLRKLHGLPCACELVHRCQYLIPIWEEDVREVRRLIKSVISIILPEDPCQPLTTPTEIAIRKGRQKTNSTKRDKNIGKSSSSGSGSRSSLGSGSGPNPRGRDRPPRSGRGRGRGRNSGRSSLSFVVNPDAPSTSFPFNNAFLKFIYEFILNWKNVVGDDNCGFRVVSNFFLGDENHWVEIHRRFCFDLHHRTNVYVQLFGLVELVSELIRRMNWEEGSAPPEYWMGTPKHLYVITNTFNLYVVFLVRLGSSTVLPLVSNMDGNARTIFIGFIEEQQHFIIPNLLHLVRYSPNLISCHHIQS
ncbi:hypothetical protein M9H77_18409 [Catharanthus roseus]|uniref:Uncharacterized protein n=1 Tax=Catharanthus roseus TaxID=4058 RepID=A0ACC0B7E1_CATRO|nr:hypothetical protein M9H77_18409 [Catharanthus roseus]